MRRGISDDANRPSGHVGLGLALVEKGRVDEGLDYMQQAVRLDPKDGAARSHLIPLLLKRGRRKEAIDLFEQLVQQENNTSSATRRRLALDRYDAACANILAAAGPGSDDARRGEAERAAMRRQALGWLRATWSRP